MVSRHASATSFASPGRMVISPGMARSDARCSIGWCVGPSSPTPIESCVKMWIVGISMIEASRSGARP
jgi:hypothetical protein